MLTLSPLPGNGEEFSSIMGTHLAWYGDRFPRYIGPCRTCQMSSTLPQLKAVIHHHALVTLVLLRAVSGAADTPASPRYVTTLPCCTTILGGLPHKVSQNCGIFPQNGKSES